MPISDSRTSLMIFLMAAITFLIRALPFLMFPGSKKTPSYILYLGKVLPYAIIGMLVIYCLKNTCVTAFPFGIPELAAVAATVLLHVWRRNTLLSISGGTFIYMFLIQSVFS